MRRMSEANPEARMSKKRNGLLQTEVLHCPLKRTGCQRAGGNLPPEMPTISVPQPAYQLLRQRRMDTMRSRVAVKRFFVYFFMGAEN